MREGWVQINLGAVFKRSNKKLGKLRDEPEIFAISKYDGVVLAQEYFNKRIASKSLDGYKVIGPRDWVYSTIHIDEGSIAVNHFPFDGVVSPMYTSMNWSSGQHDASFFEYLLKSDEALIRYQENAQGTVNRRRSLSWRTFSDLVFLVPPLVEQKRIVDVVSSVDAYIDALQQQADTARKARNAVLHELLSAGGADWTETTLGKTLEIARGGSPRPIKEFITSDEDGVNWVKIGDASASSKYIYQTKEKIRPEGISRSRPVRVGDFILSNSMSFGRPYIMRTNGCIHDGWLLFSKVEKRFDEDFLYNLLMSDLVQKQFDSLAAGSGVRNLNIEVVKEVVIALPPLKVQRDIAEIANGLDEFILAVDQSVIDAKNLRSGLLSDLLSGEHEIPESYDKFVGAA